MKKARFGRAAYHNQQPLNEQLPGRSTVLFIEAHDELAAAGLAKVKAPAVGKFKISRLRRISGLEARFFPISENKKRQVDSRRQSPQFSLK